MKGQAIGQEKKNSNHIFYKGLSILHKELSNFKSKSQTILLENGKKTQASILLKKVYKWKLSP